MSSSNQTLSNAIPLLDGIPFAPGREEWVFGLPSLLVPQAHCASRWLHQQSLPSLPCSIAAAVAPTDYVIQHLPPAHIFPSAYPGYTGYALRVYSKPSDKDTPPSPLVIQ